jgi:hypothetical protein
LIEASRLKVSDVSSWAKGYQKKAVAAVIGAVATSTNRKQTASLCAECFVQLAAALKDITLGEVLKGLASPRRTPTEVAELVRKGREAVAVLRLKYEKEWTKELGVQYARSLRNLGRFEEAHCVVKEILRRHPRDSSVEKLLESIKRYLSKGNEPSSGNETT